MIQRNLPHARHNAHIEDHIDAVGHLDSDFAKRRTCEDP